MPRQPEPTTAAGQNRTRSATPLVLFTLAAAAAAGWLHFRSAGFADPDAFYHFRHAQIYASKGIFFREFPWAQFSVIRLYAADIWYGFHLLLTPFTGIANPWLGLKLSGAVLLFTLLMTLYGVFRRLRVCVPWLWPFALLLISGDLLWRMTMLRPHVLSLGLLALLFALLLRGPRRPYQIGLVCLTLSWLHTTTSWLAPMIALPTVIILALMRRRREIGSEIAPSEGWLKIASMALLGMATGLVLRPGPADALRLLYVQLVEWANLRRSEVPLNVGSELYPIPVEALLPGYVPFAILWAGAALVFIHSLLRRRDAFTSLPLLDRAQLWISLLLSLLFYQLTMSVAWRSTEMWLTFGFIFIASVVTFLILPREGFEEATGAAVRSQPVSPGRRTAGIALGAVFLLTSVFYTLQSNAQTNREKAINLWREKAACEWLRTNAPLGAIVFHTEWSLFGELVFWNPNNYYIGGMDPVFQYAYSPNLFWKAFYLTTRLGGAVTSGTPPSLEGEMQGTPEDTYTVLTRDFNASYLLVIKPIDVSLYEHVQRDPRFTLRYEGKYDAIYQLKP